ncbi:cysteine-rich CWC family protein [Ferriphaselus amnicola]|uniref:cysteine-rich CWC family protein n=1 Tax=Ferriphaselus amnicola TaxID=1188319 RepID=UPI000A071E66
MANGKEASACWCQRVTISAAVLARVPEPLRGQVCICASCNSMQGKTNSRES